MGVRCDTLSEMRSNMLPSAGHGYRSKDTIHKMPVFLPSVAYRTATRDISTPQPLLHSHVVFSNCCGRGQSSLACDVCLPESFALCTRIVSTTRTHLQSRKLVRSRPHQHDRTVWDQVHRSPTYAGRTVVGRAQPYFKTLKRGTFNVTSCGLQPHHRTYTRTGRQCHHLRTPRYHTLVQLSLRTA